MNTETDLREALEAGAAGPVPMDRVAGIVAAAARRRRRTAIGAAVAATAATVGLAAGVAVAFGGGAAPPDSSPPPAASTTDVHDLVGRDVGVALGLREIWTGAGAEDQCSGWITPYPGGDGMGFCVEGISDPVEEAVVVRQIMGAHWSPALQQYIAAEQEIDRITGADHVTAQDAQRLSDLMKLKARLGPLSELID